ncbi:MAG: hypothetical protein JWN54_3747 [Mycobacterium sp.]|nr:hypothetical protein [Mycobacterium sp.]
MPRFPARPTPEPLDVDAVKVVTAGTALWAVAGLGLLVFRPDTDPLWLWTCATGAGLGVFGVWFCRRRRSRLGPVVAARGD